MKLYIIAGEASGELHGKNLVRAFNSRRSGIEWAGMGGDGMEAEGVRLVRHIRDTNFMGFLTVVKNLGVIRKLFRDVKADIEKFQPDAIILIDYPGFNLRIAEWAHEKGIQVLFYISPQIWAWKTGRVKKVKAFVDRMYVILPFEQDFYAKHGVEVDFVGHPLLDEIEPQLSDHKPEKPSQKPIVALLPGSRPQEIQRMLPTMLSVVPKFPDLEFRIAGMTTLGNDFYAPFLTQNRIKLEMGKTYDLLKKADYALVTSGTATLETALFEVPEVVCYSAPWLSYRIAKWLIGSRLKFISLVNLIMDRELVTELIQHDLNPKKLEQELRKFTDSEQNRAKIARDYQELKAKLGNSGASDRCAELMLERIEGKSQA